MLDTLKGKGKGLVLNVVLWVHLLWTVQDVVCVGTFGRKARVCRSSSNFLTAFETFREQYRGYGVCRYF